MTELVRPRRIHIVGGPGSGKTTLAKRLSSTLDIEMFELDEFGYPHDTSPDWNLSDKLRMVAEIANRRDWITEGFFLWWTDDLFAHTDVIVWLDIPWRTAAWRIVSRHIESSIREMNQHRGLRLLWTFLRNARRYYVGESVKPKTLDDDVAVTRAATEQILTTTSPAKTIRCQNHGEIERWLESLSGKS